MLSKLRTISTRSVVAQGGFAQRAMMSTMPDWATFDPAAGVHRVRNFVAGDWQDTANVDSVISPYDGSAFLEVASAEGAELDAFVDSLQACPKTGLHNPIKNVERYCYLGDVSNRAGDMLRDEATVDYFTKMIQATSPKSYQQAKGEVVVTRKFLENFSSDQVRFLARGFSVAGDHDGQVSHGMRFPFGPVALITPFNFPLEIPALQLLGALYMGNKPVVKVDSKVSVVMEQFLRLMHEAGLRREDVDFVNCSGPAMEELLLRAQPRNTLFTGSSHVAEHLTQQLQGRVRLEDAGFDWKVLGPDLPADEVEQEYIAWQCDQDAYASSGQKCSAQSLLFCHRNWSEAGFLERLERLAGRRKLEDVTIGPVMTWTTEAMIEHAEKLAALDGARVLWGAKELPNHSIPKQYGAVEPTAVFVPLKTMMQDQETFDLVTTEVFGPMQVVTEYDDGDLDTVLAAMERLSHHLTAAVVSNDERFRTQVLGRTVNGTTYAGRRARTTGAPQNHWFGPAGDPRGAGIGTPEAILVTWSTHREVILDTAAPPAGWTLPEAT